ncbi:MAG: hypothetical protein F4X76_12970 [Chloroflexi bacterium]|nr:hypothetical protein [Chloroflexota bacterium]
MSTLPARRQPAKAPVPAVKLLDCAVCGLQGPPKEMADCAECGAVFHIDLSQQELGRSCGAATFGQACGFSFSCNPCIERYEANAASGGYWRSVVR